MEKEDKQEIMNKYYSNRPIQFEIVKCLKNKEICFLGDKRVRCMVISKVDYLLENMNKFQFRTTINNMYYSLANYNFSKMQSELGFYCFSYAHIQRKEQMNLFNIHASNLVTSYDLGIDFDNHDGASYNLVYQDCKFLKNLFDKYGVKYSIKTSGSGFHIEIKHDYLPTYIKAETDITKRVKLIGELMTDIKLILDLDSMDVGCVNNIETGSFYELRRIFKIPYSLDYKTMLVALPLSDVMFTYFVAEKSRNTFCNPKNVCKMKNLINRGIIERVGSTEGFDLFIKEVIN
jgi:hypothetical protein